MFIPNPYQTSPPIIIADALAALEGNLPLLKTVVQMVIDQSGVDLAAIRTDGAAANSTALAASSHRLKGSLGAIAAQPAFQACSALNKLARIGAADSYAMALAHLEQELDRLLPFLHSWLAEHESPGRTET